MLNKEVAERFRIITTGNLTINKMLQNTCYYNSKLQSINLFVAHDDDVYGPTSDVADGGNNPPALEALVGLWIHHQQPGLISPFFYEGHHVGMLHGLDVHAVDLKHDKGTVFITIHHPPSTNANWTSRKSSCSSAADAKTGAEQIVFVTT